MLVFSSVPLLCFICILFVNRRRGLSRETHLSARLFACSISPLSGLFFPSANPASKLLYTFSKKCTFADFYKPMAKTDRSIKIDVHHMYVEDAMALLRDRVASAPPATEKIVVVHGYNHGTALKDAVRRLRGPRIVEVAPSFTNEGETIIWLRS